MVRSSQRDMQAAEGPPLTLTIRGYFLLESKSLGSINQPCTRVVPFVQWTLRISPQAGFNSALRVVICFQSPIGPVHTSGGALADCRARAVVNLSLPLEPLAAQALPDGIAPSSPVHSVWTDPSLVFTLPKPEFPSTFSAKVMRSEALHATAEGDDLMLGVRLRAVPPATG